MQPAVTKTERKEGKHHMKRLMCVLLLAGLVFGVGSSLSGAQHLASIEPPIGPLVIANS